METGNIKMCFPKLKYEVCLWVKDNIQNVLCVHWYGGLETGLFKQLISGYKKAMVGCRTIGSPMNETFMQ